MKEVKAYIKNHKLDGVLRALRKIQGISGCSVINSRGWGSVSGSSLIQTGDDLQAGVKLEIICPDDLVNVIVQTVETYARTGLKGDGKIYVSTIEQAIRISTGERGESTI